MGLDLTGVDAELAALGVVPRDVSAIAAREAGALSGLEEIDAGLSALEAGVTLPTARVISIPAPRRPIPAAVTPTTAPPVAAPMAPAISDRRPKSGEISLGEPVQRRPEPVSAELTLFESDRPASGAFELPDLEDEPPFVPELDTFTSPKRKPEPAVEPISLTPDDSALEAADITPLAVDPFSDSQADLSRALFSDQVEPDTIVSFEDRDADAEFDALFDEATHPSGIPTRNYEGDDDSLSADDLLSGLSGPEEHESDALTSSLFEELGRGDATDIVDAATLQAHLDPFPSEEELGSSEFEIVLDEAGAAKDIVPAPSEAASSADKRPSFLGRLFGRKDDKA